MPPRGVPVSSRAPPCNMLSCVTCAVELFPRGVVILAPPPPAPSLGVFGEWLTARAIFSVGMCGFVGARGGGAGDKFVLLFSSPRETSPRPSCGMQEGLLGGGGFFWGVQNSSASGSSGLSSPGSTSGHTCCCSRRAFCSCSFRRFLSSSSRFLASVLMFSSRLRPASASVGEGVKCRSPCEPSSSSEVGVTAGEIFRKSSRSILPAPAPRCPPRWCRPCAGPAWGRACSGWVGQRKGDPIARLQCPPSRQYFRWYRIYDASGSGEPPINRMCAFGWLRTRGGAGVQVACTACAAPFLIFLLFPSRSCAR